MEAKHKSSYQTKAVIGFAGDSGDGVQVIGQQFSKASALAGNDIQTFPDFPAEIRAPSGTVAGVSGFQLQFASIDIHTPGDSLDCLIAFNPAALMAFLPKVKPGALIVIDQEKFTDKDYKKAGIEGNPLESPLLSHYRVVQAPITTLVFEAVKDSGISRAAQRKCKNFFALGMACWVYQRPMEPILAWIESKFAGKEGLADANQASLKAGFNYAETIEMLDEPIEVSKADLPAGTWRQINGNESICLGAMAASTSLDRPLFVAGYPITPASDILHWFVASGVKTFQAEDEMAAAGAAVGAAFAGSLTVTATSGPGMDLKAETIGLAAMVELPMVIVDVQRAGPSTGMPTKVEQSDLLMALHGRHGECPVPVIAPKSPADGYQTMIEACEMAVHSMTPVIVLSDAYIANGAQPWRLPSLPKSQPKPTIISDGPFKPYQRNPETLARPWVSPGQKGFEHRVGGLEKQDVTGNISYDPDNHQAMVKLRQQKVDHIAKRYPPLEILGPKQGPLLVIGWGSTYGALLTAVESLNQQGHSIAYVHLRHLNPLPLELEAVLKAYDRVVAFELNEGQLAAHLRQKYLVDVKSHTKVKGQPFQTQEIVEALSQIVTEQVA